MKVFINLVLLPAIYIVALGAVIGIIVTLFSFGYSAATILLK